jgi:hypothetical protein
VLVLGIDPGEKPGYCVLSQSDLFTAKSYCHALEACGKFDIVAVEGQFIAPKKASRNGAKLKVGHQTVPTLALTAGLQLGEPRAELRLVLGPAVWRGLLWSDSPAIYGLAQEPTLNRLRALAPSLAEASDDEVMAFGVALAARLVGNNKTGTLRNGTPWKLRKQPGRFEVVIERPKAKARAFVKTLKGFK